MKVTVVPAQITTVEDRIIGNLSMLQLMIILIPVFGGAALFGFLPPFMEGAGYKYVLLGLMMLVCGVLSTRIKGRVLVLWLITLARYYLRPGLYLYDKNNSYMRDVSDEDLNVTSEVRISEDDAAVSDSDTAVGVRRSYPTPYGTDVIDPLVVRQRLDEADSSVRFEIDSKGGFYVRINEAEI